MDKGICKYAIPMKPPYQFPFACAVMYECRWEHGGKNIGKSCPRFQIGENMEWDRLERRRRWIVKRYDDIRKRLAAAAVAQQDSHDAETSGAKPLCTERALKKGTVKS